jgi:SNF2 family DNA or RNA helicase
MRLFTQEGEVNFSPSTSKTEYTPEELDTSDWQAETLVDLYPHQVAGVNFGLAHPKFLLSDSMGLGKTLQAIQIALERYMRGEVRHCLIVCGVNGLTRNWVREIDQYSLENSLLLSGSIANRRKALDSQEAENALFWITNIESLRNSELIIDLQLKISSGELDMIVFDEAHTVRNISAQQSKGLLKLRTPYQIAMTGTPVVNSPVDFFVPLHWLGIEPTKYWQFRKQHCVFGGFGGYQVVGYKNLDGLKAKYDPFNLRRELNDVLDLPPQIITEEFVEMGTKQAKLYKDMTKLVMDDIDKLEKAPPNPLTLLMRLRQVTSNPSLLTSESVPCAKLDRLEQLVQDIVADNGEKVIIFSVFEQNITEICNRLNSYPILRITGKEDAVLRAESIQKFQEDTAYPIIAGTIGAMGTGNTLTAARTELFLDDAWNQAINEQAERRNYRIGTTESCRVIHLVTANTVDESIRLLVKKKGRIGAAMIDGKYRGALTAFVNGTLSGQLPIESDDSIITEKTQLEMEF